MYSVHRLSSSRRSSPSRQSGIIRLSTPVYFGALILLRSIPQRLSLFLRRSFSGFVISAPQIGSRWARHWSASSQKQTQIFVKSFLVNYTHPCLFHLMMVYVSLLKSIIDKIYFCSILKRVWSLSWKAGWLLFQHQGTIASTIDHSFAIAIWGVVVEYYYKKFYMK